MAVTAQVTAGARPSQPFPLPSAAAPSPRRRQHPQSLKPRPNLESTRLWIPASPQGFAASEPSVFSPASNPFRTPDPETVAKAEAAPSPAPVSAPATASRVQTQLGVLDLCGDSHWNLTAPPPLGYIGFAVASHGRIFRTLTDSVADPQPILIVADARLEAAKSAIQTIRNAAANAPRRVLLTFVERAMKEIMAELRNPQSMERFKALLNLADGMIVSAPELLGFINSLNVNCQCIHIPAPYPLENPQWDVSLPTNQRSGIFFGDIPFREPDRNMLAWLYAAAEIAAKTGHHLSIFSTPGFSQGPTAAQLGLSAPMFTQIPACDYGSYLQHLASHRIVIKPNSLDGVSNVAGDALLSRIICVGGEGTLERVAFRESCGSGRSSDNIRAIAESLLTDDAFYDRQVEKSQQIAMQSMSFGAVNARLEEFLHRLESGSA